MAGVPYSRMNKGTHRDLFLWDHVRTRLIKRRLELGWSQERLASEMQTTQGVICNFEGGHSTPRLYTLDKWITALNMKLVLDIELEEAA